MKPFSLRLKGFIGIRDGLGVEEVMVDVSKLEGLVALIGDNGAGKTTFLDNLHPYRFMPSKTNGQYTPGAFSFYDEVCGQAEKELVFEMGGETWKSVLFINPENMKQEAYLYVLRDGEWKIKNKSGKVSQYDKLIEELVGSSKLFFLSIYRAQDAPKLNSYRKGAIKDILADLLLLEHIKEKGKKAKAVIDELTRIISTIKAQEMVLEPDAVRVTALEHQLEEATGRLSAAAHELAQGEESERQLMERLRASELEMARFQTSAENMKKTADRISVIEETLKGICRKRTSMECRQYDVYKGYHEKRARMNKILANGTVIKEKVLEEGRLLAKKQDIESSLKATRDRIHKTRGYAGETAILKDKISALQVKQAQKRTEHNGRIAGLDSEIRRIEESVNRLADLPCTTVLQNGCPAVKATVADRNRLIVANRELGELHGLTGEDPEISRQLEDLTARIAVFQLKSETTTDDVEIARFENELEQVNEAINSSSRFTRLLPELDTAGKTLFEMETDLRAVIQTYCEDLETNFHEETSAADELTLMKSTLDHLDKTLLLSQTVEENMAAIRTTLGNASAMVSSRRKEHLAATSRVAEIKGSLDNARKAADKIGSIRIKLARVQEQRDIWAVIEKGFGMDGIIALEVDDAGPEITNIANQLLSSSFGPQYSVRVDTQSLKADGELAESFDITVLSNETGETASLSDKSGGQKTWLEDAITRSVALFNAERSGKRFHTLFTDERDGALSADSKREFFILKKKALELGGFANEFFISHSPEAQNMCQHRLVFQQGIGITIQ